MRKTRDLDQRVAATSAQPSRHPLDWKLTVIPVVVVVILLAGGFTLRNTLMRPGPPAAQVGSSSPPAPDFSVAAANGPRFSLAAQRGRPVVLYFMAAWCTSCLAESNALGQIQHKYGDRVRIVLVDIGGKVDTPQSLRDFVERSQGPSRDWIIDARGTIASAYSVTSLDTTYVIDKRTHIAYSSNTSLDYTSLDQIVGQVV
jgi:peroxiredoxin